MGNFSALLERLRHQLIPAVPVPMRPSTGSPGRTIDIAAQSRMAEYYREAGVGGIAVWAHTGRGLHLTDSEREDVLRSWRTLMPELPIIAGAGARLNPGPEESEDYIARAVAMGKQARALGADALLCYAPTKFRTLDAAAENDVLEASEGILEYHKALAEVGLPLILFYLYEAAGGISYSENVLRELLTMPEVIGMKVATLDSIMTYQDIARLARTEFPEQLLITGEDRFFGYSLAINATAEDSMGAALVGMGAALTGLQSGMMAAYQRGDHSEYLRRSAIVDAFALVTFRAPMEGYIGRMLYVLGRLGVIPKDSTYDPWAPWNTEAIPHEDKRAIDSFLASLPREFLPQQLAGD